MWRARLLRRAAAYSFGASGASALASISGADAAPAAPRRPKLPIGGVMGEYTQQPRTVQALSPPKSGFFGKEVRVLGFPVRAHASVSDEALMVAADRLSRMLRHLPDAVMERLSRRGATFHIIGLCQGTTELPEHAHMRGVDGGYTGEAGLTLDQRARGMGGVQSSCGEENLIDLDADPRYPGRDILTHEFAHCIMDVGLPEELRSEIRRTHALAVKHHGRWTRADGSRAYAGSNASEYFAELTMWYFGTHGEFVDSKRRLPSPGPGGLAEHDPDGFRLLASIFGGTHPSLASADPPVVTLAPQGYDSAAAAASVDEEEVESEVVAMEFDNRGCDCAWKLFWITPRGERRQYGEVPQDATYLQQTFPGHAWLLERQPGALGGQGGKSELRYVASREACVAVVKVDAPCGHAPPPLTTAASPETASA